MMADRMHEKDKVPSERLDCRCCEWLCVEVIIEDAEQLDDADVDELEKRLDEVYDPVRFGNEGSEGVM